MRQRFGTVYEVEIVTRQGRVILETSIQLIRNHQRAIEIHGIALRPKRRQERLTPRGLDGSLAFSPYWRALLAATTQRRIAYVTLGDDHFDTAVAQDDK